MIRQNSTMPIILSIEKTNSVLPSQFRYSYVHWLGNPLGVFANEDFHFKKYFAAGTEEGPIVIFGDTGTELHQVALLCGHTRTVTGISTSLHPDTFTSVSYDAVICGWSMRDGVCLYSFQANVKPGYIKAVNSSTNVDVLYLWSLGGTFYKLNVKTGETQLVLQSFGLTSLAPTLGDTVLFTTYNTICSYNTNTGEKTVHYFTPSIHKRQFACENGYVLTKRNRVQLYDMSYVYINSIVIEEFEEEEAILKVYWRSHKLIQIVTYLGNVINITLSKNDIEYSITKQIYPNYYKYVSFTNREQFLGVVGTTLISVQDENGERFFNGNKNKRNYHLSSGNCQQYYASDHTDYIKYFDRNTVVSRYNHSHSTVSSLYSIQYKGTEYLITGSMNGTITIYNKNTEEPLQQIPALSCPVVGIVQTPFMLGGFPRILAIGEDGSSCLFNLGDHRIHYLGNHFRPRKVYIYEQMGLIFVLYQGGTILMYNLDNPDPVSTLSVIPPKATLIWSYSSKNVSTSISATGTVNIGGKGVAFDTHNFSEITSFTQTDTILLENIVRIFKLCDEELKDQPGNLVFIGANQNPTFYYDKFSISGQLLYLASPNVIVNHWVASNIISSIIGIVTKKQSSRTFVECLPMLLQMLFEGSTIVQDITAPLIINIIPFLQSSDCQQMISSTLYQLNEGSIDNLSDPNKFLLSIAVCINENLVPASLTRPLFLYLKGSATLSSDVFHVALNILTYGIRVWFRESQHTDLFMFLIQSVDKYTASSYITSLSKAAHEDYAAFLQAFKQFFLSKPQDEPSQIMNINILANSMIDNPLGSFGTLLLARFICESGIHVLRSQLDLHKHIIKSVDYNDEVIAVGTPDGNVYGFSKTKLLFEINVFKSPVNLIFLSPNNDVCFAYSKEQKEYVLIGYGNVRKGMIFKEKPKIMQRMEVQQDNEIVTIVWKQDSTFDIVFNQ